MSVKILTKFKDILEGYPSRGIAEWKDSIFVNNLEHASKKSQVNNSVVEEHLKMIFNNAFGRQEMEVKTFVMKKVYTRISSLAENGTNDFLGGCPLELEDKLEKMTFTDSISGSQSLFNESSLLSESDYSEIVSYICLLFTSYDEKPSDTILNNLFPMLVFFKWKNQSKDPHGLVYLTLSHANNEITGVIEQRVKLGGPYPSTMWRSELTPNSSPSHSSSPSTSAMKFHSRCINNLMKQHISGSSHSKPALSANSYSEYELLESNKPLFDSPDQDVSLTYVTVSIKCSKVKKILFIDKQNIDEIKIHITPVPGDMRSSAFFLYKAIQTLEGFFCAFGESGEVKWTSTEEIPIEDQSDSNTQPTIIEQIRQVIASYNQEWMLLNRERKEIRHEKKSESGNDEENTSRQMIFPREELDFTERIWEVLQYVGSCQELLESLQMILKEITEGRATQFWLHRNNNTTLAKLIKESYTGAVTTELKLDNSTGIKLLIELGIDKLSRDYNNFFITNRLASISRLESYSGDKADDVNSLANLQKRFVLLKKLHHIVELIVQCKLFLCLSEEQTFALTKTALLQYVSERLNFRKVFTFSIDYSEIETLVENRLPTVWRLQISSKEKSVEKTTCHCWTTEFPFHGIISPAFCESALGTPVTNSVSYDMGVEYYIASQTTSIFSF